MPGIQVKDSGSLHFLVGTLGEVLVFVWGPLYYKAGNFQGQGAWHKCCLNCGWKFLLRWRGCENRCLQHRKRPWAPVQVRAEGGFCVELKMF